MPLILLLFSLFFASIVQADISINLANTKLASCDEYSSKVLGDAWDMNEQSDVNNYFKNVDVAYFNNPRVSSGSFSGTTSAESAFFYLLSPKPCGSFPVGGRWGPDFPIDVNKYTKMYVRMYSDTFDGLGMRIVWDRGCDYGVTRTFTNLTSLPVKPGWHTYEIPLTSIPIAAGSTDTRGWSSGSITGLSILPTTVTGANISVDWVRLEDPTTCNGASVSASYTAAADGNDDLMSFYLDDDSNPFNGFERKLLNSQNAAGMSTVSVVGTNGILNGRYKILSILDSDYATLEQNNPWDMNESTDVTSISSSTGTTFNSGVLSGHSVMQSYVYLNVESPGINTAKYRYISIKGTFAGNISIVYTGGSKNINTCALNAGVYNCDMNGSPGWGGGNIATLGVSIPDGDYTLDFVSLRKSGYDSERDSNNLASKIDVSAGTLTVNDTPTVKIKEPSTHGGEALRAWDMESPDIILYENVTTGSDPIHNNEPYTAYLPDSRLVDGLRGNFMKGTSVQGNDDPVNYSVLSFIGSPRSFDADQYKNLCFKLNIERDFDLGTGSVGRVVWQPIGAPFYTSDDIPLIYDNWSGSRWYEYCVDMKTLITEQTGAPFWGGGTHAFRIDAHEFSNRTSYYFDYIKLRKDEESTGTYNISYDVNDTDDDATIQFYYATDKNSAGTLFATASELDPSRVIQWDTTGVPTGSYYIRAVATDGISSTSVYSDGKVQVTNTGDSGSAPTTVLESLQDGDVVCDAMQVKGYSFQPDRLEEVQAVEVLVDGSLIDTFKPTLYSPTAKAAATGVENSNAGFDVFYDSSGFSAGAHTVTLKAYSSRGPTTTITRNITKNTTGCTGAISDADPAGSPTDANPDGGVEPVQNNITLGSASHAKTGIFLFSVRNIHSTNNGCTLQLKAGTIPSALTLLKNFTLSSASSLRFKINKLLVKKGKGLKKIYMTANLVCRGTTLTATPIKAINLQQSSTGATSSSKLIKAMKKIAKG